MDSMNGFKKLKGVPVEVTFCTNHRPVEPFDRQKPAYELDPETKIGPVYLHCLTVDEITEVEAVGVEAFRAFQAKGASADDCSWRSTRVEQLQLLYLSLKIGKEPDSKPLFENPTEITTIPFSEVKRLAALFYDSFRPTGEEIKNCLRERLGDGSKTASSFPETSKTDG